MKKVISKEPVTAEAFNKLFNQYVQQVATQYSLPKWVVSDLKQLSEQAKP